MSQAAISLANASGAVFRAALNAALEAITTCHSGATEPTTMYPNMFWYDTSTSLLKRRNNANDAWIVMGLEAADTDGTLAANSDAKVATQKATKTYADTKLPSSYLDTDGALTANSDVKVASQKAGKTYADGKISKTTAGEIAAMTEKTTLADDDLFVIEDSAASNAKKKVKKSNLVTQKQTAFGFFSVTNSTTTFNVTGLGFTPTSVMLIPTRSEKLTGDGGADIRNISATSFQATLLSTGSANTTTFAAGSYSSGQFTVACTRSGSAGSWSVYLYWIATN